MSVKAVMFAILGLVVSMTITAMLMQADMRRIREEERAKAQLTTTQPADQHQQGYVDPQSQPPATIDPTAEASQYVDPNATPAVDPGAVQYVDPAMAPSTDAGATTVDPASGAAVTVGAM